MCAYISVEGHVCVMASLWGSGDSFQEWFHFFHYVGLRGHTQVTRHDSKHFATERSQLPRPYSFHKSGLWGCVSQTVLA